MPVIVILAVLGATLGAACTQTTDPRAEATEATVVASEIDSESRSRLPLLTRQDMDDEESLRIYDSIAGPDHTPPRGTIAVAMYSPQTAGPLRRINRYLRTESGLGSRLSELLILITSREINQAYEWSAHEGIALEAGLEPEVIEVVRSNGLTTGLSDEDALMITFGRQLFRDRHVDSETFARMVERLGRQGTFDAILLITHYAMAGVMKHAVNQQAPAAWDPTDLPSVPGVGTPIGQPGVFVELGPRPALAPDVYEDSYYRFPLIRRNDMNQRGREIFDREIGAERETTPRGPVGMAFNSPELVDPIHQLNVALRETGVLDTRLTEIVIAATGREMNSQYQWAVHGRAAQRAGAEPELLDAIKYDGSLSGLNDRDALAITFTRELFRDGTVGPETFRKTVEMFGTQGTVEMAELIGDYLMVTTMYNALGMRLAPNQEATLPHRAGAPIGAEWR